MRRSFLPFWFPSLLLAFFALGMANASTHATSHHKIASHPHSAVPPHHHGTARSTPSARVSMLRRKGRSAHTLPTSSRSVHAFIPPVERVKFVPAMKGSRESLVRQNVIADAEGLDRIEDDTELATMVSDGDLVMLPASSGLHINDAMPVNRRYCRPWTAKFLSDLARVHAQRFRSPLIVTSAVRTAEYQRQLLLINGNAAPAEGDLASPHLTGATIDIAKKGMSMSEVGWLRAYLLPLQTTGKLDVEEEFRQACFHISVYHSYLPAAPLAPLRHGSSDVVLAERLQ